MEMLSVDAFLRTMLDEEAYHGSVKLGATMPAMGYGTVVATAPDAASNLGKQVLGLLGAQTYAVTTMGTPDGAMQMLSLWERRVWLDFCFVCVEKRACLLNDF